MKRLPLPFLAMVLFSTGCPGDDSSSSTAGDESTGDGSTSGVGPTTLPPTTDPSTSMGTGDGSTGDPDGSTGDPETGTTTDATGSTGGSDSGGSDSGTTGGACDMDMVLCDGECIDPMTNGDWCGASDDCMGGNAGEVCSPTAECVDAMCVESCDNCSFEAMDFTDWTTLDLSMPFQPLAVVPDGYDTMAPFFMPSAATATDGGFLAFSGFDGNGATSPNNTIEIGQDVDLRMGVPADLTFDYRLAWDMTFGATMDRTFEVRIEPMGGGVPMDTVLIETATANTIGDNTATGIVDVSAYEGQTVYINFVMTIPEDLSGPGQLELDNVRFVAQ